MDLPFTHWALITEETRGRKHILPLGLILGFDHGDLAKVIFSSLI